MIYVYVGKPRNGKSLRAMMRILWTLEHTLRFIVTNMVLDLDEIQEWVDRRGLRINVRRRFLFLTAKEEMKNFWLYRDALTLEKPKDYDDKNGRGDVDYAPLFQDKRFWDESKTGDLPTLKGTLYVIDEVHTLFPARGWQGTPRHADFYNSQHGKLNDEVIFITQNTKLVDPNFYRLAQEFHYCRNHRLMKHGRFRGANKFTAHIYDGPANDSSQTTLNVEEFNLDLEVARCYDTSAGVGMPGGGTADAGAKAKGIPLWTVWACIAIAICGVYYVFNYMLPGLSQKYLTSAVHGGKLVPDAKPSSQAPSVSSPVSSTSSVPSSAPVVAPRPFVAAPGLDSSPYPTGYVLRGSQVNVIMSDGTTRIERDTELSEIQRNSVILSGEKLYIRPAPRVQFAAPTPRALPDEGQPVSIESRPPVPASSAWRIDADGVQRIVAPSSIGKP